MPLYVVLTLNRRIFDKESTKFVPEALNKGKFNEVFGKGVYTMFQIKPWTIQQCLRLNLLILNYFKMKENIKERIQSSFCHESERTNKVNFFLVGFDNFCYKLTNITLCFDAEL